MIAGTVLSLTLALVGCSSRTGLWHRYDPCGVAGEEVTCEGACGTGTSTCENGYWSACRVPETSRSCKNLCGEGEQSCVNERWSACRVPLKSESCEGTCGEGTRVCEDGAWGKCEVPPTEFPCDNTCGEGLQSCIDGVFGRCEVPVVLVDCFSACGMGLERCENGAWLPCDAPQPNPPVLTGVVRDFQESHPDFEMMGPGGAEEGIVDERLGDDGKPVYRGGLNRVHSTTDQYNFDQWYRDVPGVNQSVEIPLALIPTNGRPGFFTYSDTDFFPIDGQLFGNENNAHNYHFTLETHATFRYAGGEVFSFTGDDDMWVFVNRRLAIDLGGLHTPLSRVVSLDSLTGTHDLVVGEIYPLDFFFAERHTYESNFTIETSIADVGACP